MRNLIFAGLAAAALLSAAGASSAQPVVVERYGHWDPAWGVVPPAPSHHWRHWREHEGAWYGHVHSCMTRYHGYDAHRDMYLEGHRWVACVD
ncbi:hypothetical protein [Phenylobacterium sp.]|jgi:hypothetical protein|uniref:hypothetical protein n=1 Tax=Phenylobacterium sp. TaxID=1871053 RepID=UPI002F3F981C